MKKLTAILLIAAMLLTLGACSKKADDANGPIKIGVVGARTGESSLWGDVMYHTVQLLADEVNDNGGLLGGRKLEILSYDNRDDAVETTNVARKAILNDGVRLHRLRGLVHHHRAGRCGYGVQGARYLHHGHEHKGHHDR